MIKRRFLAHTLLIGLLYLPLNSNAQQATTCDTCSQLNTISDNTTQSNNLLQKLLETVTRALFGSLYNLGNTMTAFTAIPAVQNNRYTDEQTLLHTIETTYQGSSDEGKTLDNNYNAIFNNYLLPGGESFDANNASIAALYLNPSDTNFYSEDQRLTAQRYIALASGAAMSTVRKPSNTWLTVSKDSSDKDKKNIRQKVSSYYTFSAIQSAIADNFAYIYGLNTGQPIEGTLDNYSKAMISESGLITYILSQKAENQDWYTQLKDMGIIGLLREQTILLGGSFLMLTRIEEDLRRILVTNSAQATLALLGTQTLTDAISQIPKPPQVNV